MILAYFGPFYGHHLVNFIMTPPNYKEKALPPLKIQNYSVHPPPHTLVVTYLKDLR